MAVSGRVTFSRIPFRTTLGAGLDYAAMRQDPARGITVEVVDVAADQVVANGSTDADRSYALPVPANTTVSVRAWAEMQRAAPLPAPNWAFTVGSPDVPIVDDFARSDSIGGPHAFGDRLDPRLAFNEGFATAFAAITLADPVLRDPFGANQANDGFFNVENNNVPGPGWYGEASVWAAARQVRVQVSAAAGRDPDVRIYRRGVRVSPDQGPADEDFTVDLEAGTCILAVYDCGNANCNPGVPPGLVDITVRVTSS